MSRPARGTNLFLVLVSGVLAIQVVVLSLQNRELKAALAAEVGEEVATAEDNAAGARARFAVGDFLEPFGLRDREGDAAPVAFDGEAEHYLFLVFARGCSVCPMVVPHWRELAASVPEGVRVVGLQLEELEPGTPSDPLWRDLPFETHNLTNPREVPFEKLTAVPLTLAVDAAGMVLWVRYGVPDEGELTELAGLLGAASG